MFNDLIINFEIMIAARALFLSAESNHVMTHQQNILLILDFIGVFSYQVFFIFIRKKFWSNCMNFQWNFTSDFSVNPNR